MLDSISFLVPRSLLRLEETGAPAKHGVLPSPPIMPGSLLACSASYVSPEHRELIGLRRLGEDRRGFFDHLKPASFAKGVLKVVMTQSSSIYTAYLNDQLREDMKRDELVHEGRLSRNEAEQQAEEWEQEEWPKRWENFSQKLLIAYGKYHAITIMMRIYEAASARMFDEPTVDRLTMDTYSSSIRRAKTGQRLGTQEMFTECGWSNLIAYLADYSVHQIILGYGYYMYVQDQRRRLKSHDEDEARNAQNALHPGSILLSLTKKSVSLAFTRVVGLFCAAFGGAIGASLWPGWGTVIGINMGDGLAISITDEIVTV